MKRTIQVIGKKKQIAMRY